MLSTVQLGVYLAMQIPAGLLADRFGPRRSLTLGLLAMGVGRAAVRVLPGRSGWPSPAARWSARATPACSSMSCASPRLAPPPPLPARRGAHRASAARSGSSVGTAPLSAALGGLGWTPTFAASGAPHRCPGVARGQPAAGPARTAAPRPRATQRSSPRCARAWRAPAIRHGAVGALRAHGAVPDAHRPVGVPLPRRRARAVARARPRRCWPRPWWCSASARRRSRSSRPRMPAPARRRSPAPSR